MWRKGSEYFITKKLRFTKMEQVRVTTLLDLQMWKVEMEKSGNLFLLKISRDLITWRGSGWVRLFFSKVSSIGCKTVVI